MSKLSFSQFVLREKLKSKYKIIDFLFGNNYDNNKDNYDWMLNRLKKSPLNKKLYTVEEWNDWVNKKLSKI